MATKFLYASDGTFWQDTGRTTPATADTDPIAVTDDGGGAGNNATIGTAGFRPLLKLNRTPSGLPSILFDGSDDRLVLTTGVVAGDFWALFVVKNTGDGALLGNDGAGSPQLRIGQSANVLSSYDGSNNPSSTAFPVSQGNWSLIEFVRSGSTISFYQNGTSLGTGTFSGSPTFSLLAAFIANTVPLNGELAHAELQDVAPDVTTREAREATLWAKYFAASPVRDISATTYGSRTNTTITAPQGIVNGDYLIAVLAVGSGGVPPTPTPPAGWTQFSGFPSEVTQGGFTVDVRAYYKVAASESGDYTWTHSVAFTDGLIYCVAAPDTSAIPQVSINSGVGLTSTATGLTTVGANALVIFVDQNWELFGSGTPPTGSTPVFIERRDSVSGLLYAADGVLAVAGATGDKTQANHNGAGEPWQALLIAVKMSAAGGGGSALPAIVYHRKQQGMA